MNNLLFKSLVFLVTITLGSWSVEAQSYESDDTSSGSSSEEEESSELEELDDRLYEVEKSLSGKAPVLPIDAKKIRLGGFLTSTYSQLFNSNSSEGSFNSNRFEILLGADMTKRLNFFTAFGIISESPLLNEGSSDRSFGDNGNFKNRTNKVPLIISHGTYKIHDLLSVKIGRFIAPVGIINIEHFPPGLFLETPPMALRPIPGGVIWGNFLDGLDFFGEKIIGSQSIGYHLNISAFSFSGSKTDPTEGVGGDSTKPIFGGRFWVRFLENHVTLGVSMQAGMDGPNNQTYGSDLLVYWGRFLLKSEWASRVVRQGPTLINKRVFYFQPSMRLSSSLRLVYRFDWNTVDGQESKRVENIIGINWVPTPLLRLRMEYAQINFEDELDQLNQNPDYGRLTVSCVLSF